MKKIKKDVMLILGILLMAFLLWLVPMLLNIRKNDASAVVRIYQDGQEVNSYSLSEDVTVPISYYGENEGYNLLLIEKGQAFISDADCPDMLCVKQRGIMRNGESIICLPHKLVVQIESKEESELDAVTN